jgi:hypothetical protein
LYQTGDLVLAMNHKGNTEAHRVVSVERIPRGPASLDYIKLTFEDGTSVFKLDQVLQVDSEQ